MKRFSLCIATVLCLFASSNASAQNIGVLHATPVYSPDVVTKITDTALYTSVTPFDVNLATPTDAELDAFDVVLLFSSSGFADNVLMGDRLADYIERGGRVVAFCFSFHGSVSALQIMGRYAVDYAPVVGTGQSGGTNLTLLPVLANDPLLAGVVAFDGGTSSFRNSGITLLPGAEVVANWSDAAEPLVVKRTANGVRNVALNFYPSSSDSRADFWDASTDGVRLITNAIDYVYEVCGDGIVGANEECDDGNAENTDGCLDTCVLAACGDGFVQAGVEECDDANLVDTDACLTGCVNAVCGDGLLQTGVEVCDDGNDVDTDACPTTCQDAVCGDGFVQDGTEECDDGNDVDGDACLITCLTATCGDGVVQDGVETCDDGADNSDETVDACRTTCVAASCGDGVVDAGEQCDDGASNSDAGTCSTMCTDIEVSGECGDGVVDAGEVCDNGELNGQRDCNDDCSAELETDPDLRKDDSGCCATTESRFPTGAALLWLIGFVFVRRRRKQ